MHKEGIHNIAFMGNYLPRKCGIATFTTDLCEAVARSAPSMSVSAIAMTNTPEGYNYPKRVSFEVRQQSISDYKRAADYINSSEVDILCLQHEFGIYGGSWGSHLVTFLNSINVPVITTLHTVLDEDRGQDRVMQQVANRSKKLVVMSKRALKLLERYDVADDKKVFIPHGIPDLPFVDPNYYKDKFKAVGKKLIFSFGLIGPDKGLEYMLQAMPAIIKQFPNTLYIILGMTHPEVLKHQGEEYYLSLERLVDKLEIRDHVFFHKKFVELDELCEYLCAADIYVTPYLNAQQITSGTLAYALGAGKAVVSTPYWYAEEALAEGRGVLVDFKDADALSDGIIDLLGDEVLFHRTRKNAYQFGRNMTWDNVALSYLKLFNDVRQKSLEYGATDYIRPKKRVIQLTSLPELNLNQLKNLTSHYGMVQHAKYTVPDFRFGYCLDDNARALIFAAKHFKYYKERAVLPMLDKYFGFVINSQNADGRFTNFYDMGLRPTKENSSNLGDWQGRGIWALGYMISKAPDYYWMIAKEHFEKAIPHIKPEILRQSAFAVLGTYFYLQRYGGARDIRRLMELLCDNLVETFEKRSDDRWAWFEDSLTYANGVLPAALFRGYRVLGHERYLDVALKSSQFLIDTCFEDDTLSLVGNYGWYKRTDATKFHYDQQPIDAYWMVELCKDAYVSTKDKRYLYWMKISFDWFLGANDANEKLYDFVTGGCCDGLSPTGPNLNQGAESTLSLLLSLLSMIKMSAIQEETLKSRDSIL